MNTKGSLSLYFAFILFFLFVIFLGAILAPMISNMTVKMYSSGQMIMNDANYSAAQIQDANMRAQIQGLYQGVKDSTVTNVDILSKVSQYAWVLVVLGGGLIIFILTRKSVEYERGQGMA